MSNQDRDADDVDYMLRDALRRTNDSVPNPQRVFAAVRARIVSSRSPARSRTWSLAAPIGDYAYTATSYWYLAPLARMVH